MNRIDLRLGKSEEVLRELPENSIDSVVTDPPYHLTSIVKRFGGKNAAPAQFGTDGAYARASRGFMGKEWDGGDIAFRPEFWAEVFRVLKPGGHLLAFSGSRTYHRMACGIEDAGFEIRDQIMWLYGSGFPKSHDVSKGIDRAAGAEREVIGQNGYASRRPRREYEHEQEWGSTLGGSASANITAPATDSAKQWQGWGSALKPAHEPIVVARKPLAGTIAENVLQYGTGALNIDGCRVGDDGGTAKGSKPQGAGRGIYGAGLHGSCEINQLDAGRWPANVIHDGSDEATDPFPNDGESSAARFFYCAKASKEDRDEGLGGFDTKYVGRHAGTAGQESYQKNTHPTVKPTDLMRYLCRMVTPPGGLVLDPFMGSGSTGKAAMLEGFRFLGIDMTPEYVEIARARIQHAHDQKYDIESLIRAEAAHSDQMSLFDAVAE